MHTPFPFHALLLLALLSSPVFAGDLDKLLNAVGKQTDKTEAADKNAAQTASSPLSLAGLSSADMNGGLKAALAQGIETAVNYLGREGGFLNNADVKIPLPGMLEKVDSALRRFGQGKIADDLITAMNRAAEKAVPETIGILSDTVQNMSVEDAAQILQGKTDAATEYFREHSATQLQEKLLPIVKKATGASGVGAAYKALSEQAGGLAGGLGGLLGKEALDIDHYVTGKTLDGLFSMIAKEEKRIRELPLARGTDLLKKVFGGSE